MLGEKQTDASRAMPGWKVEGGGEWVIITTTSKKLGLWQIWFFKLRNTAGIHNMTFLADSDTLFSPQTFWLHTAGKGVSNINDCCSPFRWARSGALVLCTHRPGLLSHWTLPEVQPPFSFLLLVILTDCFVCLALKQTLCFHDWRNKLTLKDDTVSHRLTFYVADPAIFPASHSVLGYYFLLTTACLFSFITDKYFRVCIITSLILQTLTFLLQNNIVSLWRKSRHHVKASNTHFDESDVTFWNKRRKLYVRCVWLLLHLQRWPGSEPPPCPPSCAPSPGTARWTWPLRPHRPERSRSARRGNRSPGGSHPRRFPEKTSRERKEKQVSCIHQTSVHLLAAVLLLFKNASLYFTSNFRFTL